MKARILFTTTMLTSCLAVTAMAADVPAANAVEEVVVTAQKRSENVQDVPISMEVVSAKAVEAFHTDTLHQLNVPNLNVSNIGGNDIIYVRGFGSPASNYGFDQSVSLYVDGVYAGRSRQFMAPFFDLQRVEVLRGPQGALFGKNTAAGAISIISTQPTKTFEAAVTGIYNFDQKGPELSGYVSGPLSDAWSARLAVKLSDKEGYIHNSGQDRDDPHKKEALARLTVKYAPDGSPFDYTAKAEFSQIHDVGNINVSGPLTGGQKPRDTRSTIDYPMLGDAGWDNLAWNISGTGNLDLGPVTLVSVTGFSRFRAKHVNDFDLSIPNSTALATAQSANSFPERFQQVSQELRLVSPTGRKLEYIVGAYYDSSQYQLDGYNYYTIPGVGVFLPALNFKQQAESYSVFAQGTYHVSDEFRVLGSLRYSHTEKRGWFQSKSLAGPFPFRPITTAQGNISEGNTDPSFTLQYDVAPRVMVYATYGQGSKAGGFVSNTYGTTNATFTFRPERSKNYEVGVKSTLLDGTLVLNASVFDTSFSNLQVSVFNPTTAGYVVGNAAEASSKGVELSVVWAPIHNLDFTANGAYQDVKYDNYPGAQCLATQTLAQCNPASPASTAANNIKGHPLPNISKLSGMFQAHYVVDLAGDLQVGSTVSVTGRSKFFNSDDESLEYGQQKGYAKVDARIELSPTDRKWHLALVGTNLGDTLTTSAAVRLPAPISTPSRAFYWVEPGRNISIEAGYKF